MIGVVAIGTLAKQITTRLSEYTKDIVTFEFQDLEKPKKTMKEYEESFDQTLDVMNVDSLYCLIEGSVPISGIALKVLAQFKDKPIAIFYLTKDEALMSTKEKENNNICINVLQEYTRSGLFEHMFIMDHELMWESIIGNVEQAENKSLSELRLMLFDKICLAVYTYQQIRHETPMDGAVLNFEDTIYRISTFCEVKNNTELVPYYQLRFPRSYSYILNLPDKLSKEDLQLMRLLKSKTKELDNVNVAVYKDTKKSLIALCSTNIVQESKYIN